MGSKCPAVLVGMSRIKVVVSVEIQTLDGTQDEEQIIGREAMGWSRLMEVVCVTPGSEVSHMDSDAAAQFVSQNAKDYIAEMLAEGYEVD